MEKTKIALLAEFMKFELSKQRIPHTAAKRGDTTTSINLNGRSNQLSRSFRVQVTLNLHPNMCISVGTAVIPVSLLIVIEYPES